MILAFSLTEQNIPEAQTWHFIKISSELRDPPWPLIGLGTWCWPLIGWHWPRSGHPDIMTSESPVSALCLPCVSGDTDQRLTPPNTWCFSSSNIQQIKHHDGAKNYCWQHNARIQCWLQHPCRCHVSCLPFMLWSVIRSCAVSDQLQFRSEHQTRHN